MNPVLELKKIGILSSIQEIVIGRTFYILQLIKSPPLAILTIVR